MSDTPSSGPTDENINYLAVYIKKLDEMNKGAEMSEV